LCKYLNFIFDIKKKLNKKNNSYAMLLRDTSIKERKEKVIINHRKIQIDNINLIKRQEENNQHQKTIINNKEEEEE